MTPETDPFETRLKEDPRVVYQKERLTAVDFPIGAMGGGTIRMNGKAEREWWQIFHNFEEREGTGKVPNSFFALRVSQEGTPAIRALQTSSVGKFTGMKSLRFEGEYPFAWYRFEDQAVPVEVSLEAFNPFIPMDMKNSAIPCGIFRISVRNPTERAVEIGLLATQQNAVGFSGYDTIGGENLRENPGYGLNRNTVTHHQDRVGLSMTGPEGSLHLSVDDPRASGCSSWGTNVSLFQEFLESGKVVGPDEAHSPSSNLTVDGALSLSFRLTPGETKTTTYIFCWHLPGGDFGKADCPIWFFKDGGQYYENWWKNAEEVDQYVFKNLPDLEAKTRLFHRTLYSSNLPRFLIDRMTANLSVLKSPTCFWTKAGYFGIWESTSNDERWKGNVKHVIHYAQGHARLFPELGRLLREIDLDTQSEEGLLPSRDKEALDGHFGTILSVYREHLLSDDTDFLMASWPRTRKAMDYAISTFDPDRDGMLSGSYHNTLDCNSSGTSPWIGSMYIAALKACSKMAERVGESDLSQVYACLADTASRKQNEELWNEDAGHYVEKAENLPDTRVMGDAVSIDMFLGQWWANQLNLGRVYPLDRTLRGLRKIYETNAITDPGEGYPERFRDFLAPGDRGWQMFVHSGKAPENTILYYCEVMSGFEYAAAATMIQYGMVDEGLDMVREISNRYDGRLRGPDVVTAKNNSTVFGTGSPFGEDECGDFYVRPLSSWSLLLAMQGFLYDGPMKRIGFKPIWQPTNHVSFFTTAEGWGLFSQQRNDRRQTQTIQLTYGTLTVSEMLFECEDGWHPQRIRVRAGENHIKADWKRDGSEIRVTFAEDLVLTAGKTLVVEME